MSSSNNLDLKREIFKMLFEEISHVIHNKVCPNEDKIEKLFVFVFLISSWVFAIRKHNVRKNSADETSDDVILAEHFRNYIS